MDKNHAGEMPTADAIFAERATSTASDPITVAGVEVPFGARLGLEPDPPETERRQGSDRHPFDLVTDLTRRVSRLGALVETVAVTAETNRRNVDFYSGWSMRLLIAYWRALDENRKLKRRLDEANAVIGAYINERPIGRRAA